MQESVGRTFGGEAVRTVLMLMAASCLPAAAGSVYVTDYEYQADLSVFVVDYEYQADLCVYVCDYGYQAGGSDAVWFFEDYEYQADVSIFYADYEYQADLLICFVDYEYQSGWQGGHPWQERLH